jgi:hypothetical protein
MISQRPTRVMLVPRIPHNPRSGFQPEPTSGHASALVLWRSFGVALLAALRQSRERQAAREIEYHRHLIEGARIYKLNRPKPRLQSGGMVVKIAIIATVGVLGLLHIIGGTMLERQARGESKTAILSGD